MTQIVPSIFAANICHLNRIFTFLVKERTEMVHIDMMDGHFVPHIAFGEMQIKQLKKQTTMSFDVHMMVSDPERHLHSVLKTGAEMICFHFEATAHADYLIKQIKKAGRKAGLAINPATSLTVLEYLLDDLDYVLLMGINPGRKNEAFLPQCLDKINQLKAMIKDRDILIEVDGGIDDETANQCKQRGADLIVVGGFLFSDNPELQYDKLRSAIRSF